MFSLAIDYFVRIAGFINQKISIEFVINQIIASFLYIFIRFVWFF
jgi:hypothetical protein